MKILDLHLRAFGPFTDRHLDLSGGQHGLHLIFGPNEAGKSSALRALRALLYGIPERTQDDFLHQKKDLRVGGRLRGSDGTDLVCFRRKGHKNTLLDAACKAAIDDECLTRLLGGVDGSLFERLFGIDHESLVRGGQELLAEQGREAEALFGSGLGGVNLHAVLKGLDEEASQLFVPRGSKPLINKTLTQFVEIERQQRDASLSARHWEETRKIVEQAQRRLAELDADLSESVRQRSRLERIRRTLPDLARRAALREQLAQLGETPHLSPTFGQRREASVSQRALAVAAQRAAQNRHTELQAKVAALTISEDLLAEAEAIDDLRESLGSHRKAAKDRPALVAERAALESQAAVWLAQVRPDLTLADAPGLRSRLNRRRRVTELGGSREARLAAVEQAARQLAESRRRLADKNQLFAALPPEPPLDGLRRALDEARRAGDLEQAGAEARARLLRHLDDSQRELAALGCWDAGLDDLCRVPLPVAETIERFATDFQALDESHRTLDRSRAETEAERRRIAESLRAFQLAGRVPSEADLDQTRAHRDQGWQLLKRQWLDGADVTAETRDYGAGRALPVVFEESLSAADEVADRLRRESQRVYEQATTQARLETCEQRLREIERAQNLEAGRREALQQSWQSLWSACGITPLPPREMQPWLTRAVRLRERVAQGDDLRSGVADLEARQQTHARTLHAALTALGLPAPPPEQGLGLLLNQAEAHLAAFMESGRRRERLEKDLAELEDTGRRLVLDVETAEKERHDWLTAWAALMDELGLAQDTSPGEASDHLKTLDDSLKQIREAERLAERIAGIDADAAAFGQRASGLLTRLASDLLARPLEEAVIELHQRLGRQREDQSRRDELLTQLRQAGTDRQQAESAIRAADAILAELCREAGCDSPDDLIAVEQRAQIHRQCLTQLDELESALVSAGDGLGLADLQAEADSTDRDALPAELGALETRIESELRPRQAELLEQRLNAERDFADMAGTDQAAALAEAAQQTLASLRSQSERYVRLKLAARILRDEIERFRRQHRDPILTRASGYFARLTCHAFSAIETGFDDADQPVLVGLRATGERLRVDGMSTGTRDQLYLALRLANLDHRLDRAEPLPFIVDDILIQFDDLRARATLAALADFSARTQVILFTHHQRVVEQARELDPAGERVMVHELI